MNADKISCICITRNNAALLERAIACFQAQTYGEKELVIVHESGGGVIDNVFRQRHSRDIVYLEIPLEPKQTLGELRNMAIASCSGRYFCQWDDDDWYAADRLEIQMGHLRRSHKSACMLTYWLMFDSRTQIAYLSPFRLWEGSILCLRSALDESCRYADLARGEDTIFLGRLLKSNLIFPIIHPTCYIYIFHGGNTWNYEHFTIFFNRSLRLSDGASHTVSQILQRGFSVEEGTRLLNSPSFLAELAYRFEMNDCYSGRLI